MSRQREPYTASHRSIDTGAYIRLAKDNQVEYFHNNTWVTSDVINQDDIFIYNRSRYVTIFKTGIAKTLCNLYLFSIKSDYRIP